MTLRLTEEQDRLLQRLADSQGISKQEAVTRAIETAARDRAATRAAVLGRIVAEDAELLALLAQ